MARIPSIPILGQGAPQAQEPAMQELPPLPELSTFVIPQEPPMVTESERRIEEERSTSGVGDFLSTLGQTFTNVLPGSILQGGMSVLQPGPTLAETVDEMRADWLLEQASKAESQGRFPDAARMRIESDRLRGKLGSSGALRSAIDEMTFGSGSALTGESGMFGQPLPLTREEFGQTLYAPEGWGTFLGGLTGSVAMSGLMAVQPQLAPAVLASFGAMGYAGARQSYIDAMAEAGVEPDLAVADTVGLAGGLIELVSERIGLDSISDAARKKIISELAEAAVSGEIRKASKTAARVIAQSIPGAAIESIEEAVAQVGQNISVLVGEITTTGVVPSMEQAASRIASGLGEALLGGGIAGGALVTGIGAAQIPQMERDVYRRAAKMRIERDNLGDFKSISTVDDDAIADAALGGIQFDLTVGGEALTRNDAVEEAGRRGLLLSQEDLLTRESLEKAVEDPRKAAMARAAQARLFALSQAGMPEESMSFSRSDIRSMTGQSNAGEFNSRAARRRLASDLFGRVDGETYSPPVEIPEPRIAPTMEARAAEPETEDERLVARFQNNVRRQGIRSNLRAVVQEDLTEADRQVEADAAKRGLRVVWFEGTSSARIGGAAGDEKGVVYLRKTGRGSFDRGALRDAYLGILTHEASHDAELSEQGAKDVAALLDAAIPNYRGMDLKDKIEWAAARGYDPDLLNESNIDSEIAAILQENTETLRSSGALSALVADRNRFGRALDWVRRGLTKLGFNGQEAKAVLRHLEKSATRPAEAISDAVGAMPEGLADAGEAEAERAVESRLSAGKKQRLGFQTYYSQLERVLAESKQRKMTPDQFKALLSKGAVSNEEMYWTGIADWMKGKDSLDLDEALSVVKPVIEDTRFLTARIPRADLAMQQFEKMVDRRIADLDEDEYLQIASGYQGEDEEGRRQYVRNELVESVAEEVRDDEGGWSELHAAIGKTRFSPITYPSLVLQGPMFTYSETLATWSGGLDDYLSDHWDTVENVLVHARWTVRPFVSSGSSSDEWAGVTLFVEEIQSDWHQEGRKKGYGYTKPVLDLANVYDAPLGSDGTSLKRKRQVNSLIGKIEKKIRSVPLNLSTRPKAGWEYNTESYVTADITPLIDGIFEELEIDRNDPRVSRRIKDEIDTWRGGIPFEIENPSSADIRELISKRFVNGLAQESYGPPKAPFKSTEDWSRFMLKRLVSMAAYHKPLDPEQYQGRITRITLADASEQRRRSGGGTEAFAVQYDKIMPRELERIAKKFGAKIDRVSIPMSDGSTKQFVSMEINDSVRTNIRKVGFPLFSAGRAMNRQAFNSAIVSKFSESYDQTGIVDETTGFLLDDGTPVTMGMDGIRGEDHRGIVGGKAELKRLGVSAKSIKDAEQGTRTPAMFELMRIGSLLRTFIHRAGGGGVALGVSLAPGQTVTPDQRRALRDFVIERRPTLLTVDTFRDDGSSVSREIDDPVADDVGDLLRFSASRRINAMLSRHRGQFVDLKLPIGSPLAYARMAQRLGVAVSVEDLAAEGVSVHMVDGFDSGYAYLASESGAVTVTSMVVADISQPLVVESMVLHAVSRNPEAPALVVGAIDDYNLQAALVAMGADLTFDQDEGTFRADIGSLYPAEVRAGIAERGLEAWHSHVRGLRVAEPEAAAGVRAARGRADSGMPRLAGAAAVEGAGAEVAQDGGRRAGVVAGRRGLAAEVAEAKLPKRLTPAETAQRLNRRQFIIPDGSYEHDLIDWFLKARSAHSVAETEVRDRTKALNEPFKETTAPARREVLMKARREKLDNAKKAAVRARAEVIEVGNALRFAQEHRFSMLGIPWMAPASKGVDNNIPIGDLMPGVEVADVQTIASALNRWALDIIGYNARSIAAAQSHVVMAMTDELVEAARRGGTAADWYIALIEETKSVWRMAYPKELGADTNQARRNMDVLLVIMAITSNGERVDANVAHTRKVFDHYLKTGKIEVPASKKGKNGKDDEKGLQRAAAVKKTFAFFNAMSAFYDHDRVMDLLKIRGTERKQMLDLTATIRKDLGLDPKELKFSSDIPDGEQMQLSQLFGPKIGAFWANLNGNFDILTADLWFTRTFAYYMANLTTPESRVIKARIEELGQIAAGKITSRRLLESGKKKGVKVSEAEILEAARLLGFDPSMMQNPAALGAWIESTVPKWQKAENYTVDIFPAIESQSVSMKEAARGVLHGMKAIYEGDPRISEAPEGAAERGLMANYMMKAIKVAEKNGYPMPVSSAQALLWYWEKDVYYAFNAGERGEGQDFANASRKVLADRLPAKSATRLSVGVPGPVFRNALVDHLSTMQDKATPQQVLAHIAKNSRAAAHADWADIRSFLEGKEKVAKKDLVEWATINDIVVGETMLTNGVVLRNEGEAGAPISSIAGTYVTMLDDFDYSRRLILSVIPGVSMMDTDAVRTDYDVIVRIKENLVGTTEDERLSFSENQRRSGDQITKISADVYMVERGRFVDGKAVGLFSTFSFITQYVSGETRPDAQVIVDDVMKIAKTAFDSVVNEPRGIVQAFDRRMSESGTTEVVSASFPIPKSIGGRDTELFVTDISTEVFNTNYPAYMMIDTEGSAVGRMETTTSLAEAMVQAQAGMASPAGQPKYEQFTVFPSEGQGQRKMYGELLVTIPSKADLYQTVFDAVNASPKPDVSGAGEVASENAVLDMFESALVGALDGASPAMLDLFAAGTSHNFAGFDHSHWRGVRIEKGHFVVAHGRYQVVDGPGFSGKELNVDEIQSDYWQSADEAGAVSTSDAVYYDVREDGSIVNRDGSPSGFDVKLEPHMGWSPGRGEYPIARPVAVLLMPIQSFYPNMPAENMAIENDLKTTSGTQEGSNRRRVAVIYRRPNGSHYFTLSAKDYVVTGNVSTVAVTIGQPGTASSTASVFSRNEVSRATGVDTRVSFPMNGGISSDNVSREIGHTMKSAEAAARISLVHEVINARSIQRLETRVRAPFEKRWPQLVAERAIQIAAQMGIDRVSFASSEVHVERWDTESVEWTSVSPEDDIQEITDIGAELEQLGFNIDDPSISTLIQMDASPITDEDDSDPFYILNVVDASVASRNGIYPGFWVVDLVSHRTSEGSIVNHVDFSGGNNIEKEIGDIFYGRNIDKRVARRVVKMLRDGVFDAKIEPRKEGMQQFYDRKTPSDLSKFVKRYGATVSAGTFHGFSRNAIAARTFPTTVVNITPELKAAVLGGITKFSASRMGMDWSKDAETFKSHDVIANARAMGGLVAAYGDMDQDALVAPAERFLSGESTFERYEADVYKAVREAFGTNPNAFERKLISQAVRSATAPANALDAIRKGAKFSAGKRTMHGEWWFTDNGVEDAGTDWTVGHSEIAATRAWFDVSHMLSRVSHPSKAYWNSLHDGEVLPNTFEDDPDVYAPILSRLAEASDMSSASGRLWQKFITELHGMMKSSPERFGGEVPPREDVEAAVFAAIRWNDPRDYGLRIGWIRVHENAIQVKTLDQSTITRIADGVYEVMDELAREQVFDIEVVDQRRMFESVPFSELEKGSIMALAPYRGARYSASQRPVNPATGRGYSTRDKDYPVERGMEAVIRRISLEMNRGDLSVDDGVSMMAIARMVGYTAMHDVGIRFVKPAKGDGGWLGRYDTMRSLVMINRDAMVSGEVTKTFVHEMWHSVTRLMEPEFIEAIRKDYLRDVSEFIERYGFNPRGATIDPGVGLLAQSMGIDLTDPKYYRLITIDEYIAVTMSDLTMERLANLSPQSKSVIDYMRQLLGSMIDWIRGFFTGRPDLVYDQLVDRFLANGFPVYRFNPDLAEYAAFSEAVRGNRTLKPWWLDPTIEPAQRLSVVKGPMESAFDLLTGKGTMLSAGSGFGRLSREELDGWKKTSKVVRNDGSLRNVYHGTMSGPFERFDVGRIGRNARQRFSGEAAQAEMGFWFTDDKKAAMSDYANLPSGDVDLYSAVSFMNRQQQEFAKSMTVDQAKKFEEYFGSSADEYDIDAGGVSDRISDSVEGMSKSDAALYAVGSYADEMMYVFKGDESAIALIRNLFDPKMLSAGPVDTGSRLVVANLNMRNPLYWPVKDKARFFDEKPKAYKKMVDGGHDGIIYGDPGDHVYFVPDADQIHVVASPADRRSASKYSAGLPPIKRSEMTPEMRVWSEKSKVVDADGNLMPVYHGTSSKYDFSEFSTTDENGYPLGAYRGGILAFFSTDPKFASDYATEDGRVIPSVLNIVKPFDFRNEQDVDFVLERFGDSTGDGTTFLVGMTWAQFKKAVRRGEYDVLENEDFVMFLRRLGYDGIVTKELGAINYAIFEPNQVKGYFNAMPTDDPRFMYSAGLRFRETRTNIIRTRGQDAYIMLEKALEDFEAAHGALPPSKNPLLAIRRMPGAIGVKQGRFRENQVNPLLRRMTESGISMRYMGEYLFALHAIERNAYVRQINPGATELGSGMTDKRANDIIGAVNARSDSAVWQSIAAEWQAIARESLDTQLAAGLITKADYDNITARYKNYVPMIDAPEGSGPPLEQEVKRFSLGKRQLRQTTGRGESAATEEEFTGVIVHIVGQRETVMSRAYRNIVANRFLQLARYREEPGLWRIIPEPTRRQVNLNTGVVEEVPDNSWRNDPTIMEVLVIKPFVRRETETVDGVLTTVEREYGKGSRVLVKIESEELGKNLTRGNIPGEHWAMTALRVAKAWTNYVRLFATSAFNPDFLLSNPSRDVQGAIASVITEEAKAKEVMKDFARGYPAAFKAVFSALHGKEIRDEELAKHWRKFEDLGGRQTLFVPQDFDERYQELMSEMSDPTRMQVAGRFAKKAVVDIWDNLNGVMDNSIRFSYYVAAVRAGVDPEIAAVKARNLTVDFSKRGSQTAQVMQMYAFANAGIQGTTKFARLTKSRRGRVIIGSLFVTGFLNAMLQDLLSDEDDDKNGIADAKQVPEWKHDTNIVIPTGLGVSAKVPLNYGLNVPYVLGRKFWQTMSGSKPLTTAAGEAAASMLATFNPFGGEGLMDSGHGFVRALAPDILDIPIDVVLGKDFRGNDLYKINPFEKDPVLSETGSSRVPDSIKAFSRLLNASTGGDYATSGFIDLPPDAVWYVMMQLTGGTGRSIERIGKTVSNLIEGSVEVSEIPGIRRFVEEYPTPESNTSIYYEIRDQVSAVDARVGRYETEREKYAAIRESGMTESAIDAIKSADKEIRAIRKEIRELEASGRSPRTVEILNERLDRIRADAILRFTRSVKANR